MSKPIIQRYFNFQERDDHFSHVCFADSETTGLYPEVDEMIQFCLMTGSGTYIWYIEPEHNPYEATLSKFATSTKIDVNHHRSIMDLSYGRKRMADQLTGDTVIKYHISAFNFARELAALLEDQVVIMHNGIRFDAQFINTLFARYGLACNWACLDSMVMAREMRLPTASYRYNQAALGQYFHIMNDDAHDAYGDTKQLIRIFQEMVKEQERRHIQLDWYEKKQ